MSVLIAAPLGLIGLYVRLRLEETPAYEQHAQERGDEQQALGEQLRDTVVRPWRPLLICMGLVLAFNVTNYTLTQYMPTYLSEEVGLPPIGWDANPILYIGCGLLFVLSVSPSS